MFDLNNTNGFSQDDLVLLNRAMQILVESGVDESNAADIVNNNWDETENTVESLTGRWGEMKTKMNFLHNGIEWRLVELADGESWSIAAMVESDEECDGLWPDDEFLSKMAGVELRSFDAGDDPDHPESILRVVNKEE